MPPTSWPRPRSAVAPGRAYGHSVVIDPWGTVIAQAPDVVGIVRAELDLDRVASIRRQIPVLTNGRPEAYRSVARARGR